MASGVAEMFVGTVVSPLITAETKREARKVLVKHPALVLVVKMLVQRLQRSDDMAAKCIEMLDFLAFSRKFIRVLGSDKAFGDVRESTAELVLIRAVRLVSVSEEDFGALELLCILNQLLFEDEMRACVLCRASVREKLLDLVGLLIKGIERMVEMAKGAEQDKPKEAEVSKHLVNTSARDVEAAGRTGSAGAAACAGENSGTPSSCPALSSAPFSISRCGAGEEAKG